MINKNIGSFLVASSIIGVIITLVQIGASQDATVEPREKTILNHMSYIKDKYNICYAVFENDGSFSIGRYTSITTVPCASVNMDEELETK